MVAGLNLVGLLAAAGPALVSAACVIPSEPLSDTILQPFQIQIQNASYPIVNNRHMNPRLAGGGDRHLYTEPVGEATYNLTLVDGAITVTYAEGTVRAVIGGEHSNIDNTDKIFMTGRNNPKAIYKPTWGCNPDTDQPQIELVFQGHRKDSTFVPGGWTCVRPTYDTAYEFRYYPPGNLANDPNKYCIKVILAVRPTPAGGVSTSTTTQSTTASATTTVTTSTPTTLSTVTTTPATPGPTGQPSPFTDMTAQGHSFVGCAPEERYSNDGPGRTLTGAKLSGNDMTNDKCLAWCKSKGFALFGTQYRRECYCGNALSKVTRQPATTKASLAGCSSACVGDANQVCGGSSWLSLYQQCDAGQPCANAVFS